MFLLSVRSPTWIVVALFFNTSIVVFFAALIFLKSLLGDCVILAFMMLFFIFLSKQIIISRSKILFSSQTFERVAFPPTNKATVAAVLLDISFVVVFGLPALAIILRGSGFEKFDNEVGVLFIGFFVFYSFLFQAIHHLMHYLANASMKGNQNDR